MQNMTIKTLGLTVCAFLWLMFASATDQHVTTIFTIGDSTMANKDTTGDKQERGWGMMLQECYDAQHIRIDNHAVNGRSSLSFINEGRWDRVLEKMRPGDYVIIQFGHNDEKPQPDRHTEPGSTFDANLEKFVREARQQGGIPILMNAVVRRNFAEDGDSLIDTHGLYRLSPRQVAERLHVPFVDANSITHELEQRMGREGSKWLHMWFQPGEHPSEPNGKQDNTHYNIYGARTVARLLADALCEEVPVLKPYRTKSSMATPLHAVSTAPFDNPDTIVVDAQGTGQFCTIAEAIEVCRAFMDYHKVIYVKNGIYKEKLIIPQWLQNIEICGESKEGTVITFDDHANVPRPETGLPMGTFRTYTLKIEGNDIMLKNLTVQNNSARLGQAVALHTEGDRLVFINCRFIGHQDTIYTGMPYTRLYFEQCYICGTTDFIFGASAAWFEDCTIESLSNSYITA
ncbi:MAG: pectin esterase, partial [Bacteroidaceae bacterium]|nr:pectin esterase [Bacteroidaceae bacterium]